MQLLVNTLLKRTRSQQTLTRVSMVIRRSRITRFLSLTQRQIVTCTAIAFFAAAAWPIDCSAQIDRYVDAVAGVDAAVCDDPANPCQTIGYAIGVAAAGDTINLISLAGVPTTFFESGLSISFNLAIVGEGMLQTEIDAQDIDRIFSVNANLVVIDGVTLRNGNAGINTGGAIELVGGDLIVSRTRLLDNEANAGGAIAAGASAGDIVVFASLIQDNLATGPGGGIWCDECDSVTTMFSGLLDNVAAGQGGAIYAEVTTVTVSLSGISRNNADEGGGIWANYAITQVLDSTMADNDADMTDGGAIFTASTLNIQRSTLEGNSAPFGNGGAVYVFGGVDFVSANSTYSGNSAASGGGLGFFGNVGATPDVLIGTSTFFNNESTFGGVGDHVSGAFNTFGLYNSIVSSNLATGNPSCSAPFTAGNHNLIDDATCIIPGL